MGRHMGDVMGRGLGRCKQAKWVWVSYCVGASVIKLLCISVSGCTCILVYIYHVCM